MKVAIITGSAGLIGSQACEFFSGKGYKIIEVSKGNYIY
jgi:NAD(P)-dependent dehydrogenase (short-subunit alcohol dehydrogenase family)